MKNYAGNLYFCITKTQMLPVRWVFISDIGI